MSDMDMSPLILPELILFFVLGTVFGSFGNVLIFRLPKGETIFGRSHCTSCNKTLRAWQLIPIVSFVLLRAKCASCKKPISWQYPLVEIACGSLFAAAFTFTHFQYVHAAVLSLVLWLLFTIAIIDARTMRIPDALNFPLVLLSAVYAVLMGQINWLALVIGLGFFGLQWVLSNGAWVGSGDIILVASMALILGSWEKMIVGIFLAYIIGSAVAALFLLTGNKSRKDVLAFAPFLVASTIATLLYGDIILFILYGG